MIDVLLVLEEMEIVWGSLYFSQCLEFRGIPFRCHGCRKASHLQVKCHSSEKKAMKDDDLFESSTTSSSSD